MDVFAATSGDAVSPDDLGVAADGGGTALVCGRSRTSCADAARVIAGQGWQCSVAHEIDRAGWLASVRNFRLVVVIGDGVIGDGLPWTVDALAKIRSSTMSPVLVAFPDPSAQSRLLDLGADMVIDSDRDDELFRSAMRAVVRRSSSTAPVLRHLEADGMRVDLWSRTAFVDEQLVDLSPTEFGILHHLMSKAQVAVKHHDIIRAVWGWKYTDDRNALRIHINRLRRKIGDTSDRPRFLRSLRGIGYCFVRPVSEFADDRDTMRNAAGRDDPNVLLKGHLGVFSRALLAAGSRQQACTDIVNMVVSEGLCDAAAVLARHPDADELHLVAQAGMSPKWVSVVGEGVPLTQQFLASETVRSRQTRNYVDIRKFTGRYGPTVRLLREAELPVILSIPLADQNGVWGQMGCARRADSAFTPAHCMVLEAAAYLLGARFAEDGPQPATAS